MNEISKSTRTSRGTWQRKELQAEEKLDNWALDISVCVLNSFSVDTWIPCHGTICNLQQTTGISTSERHACPQVITLHWINLHCDLLL